MAAEAAAHDHPAHPSPHRAKVSLAALLFGVWGGPVAWIVQLCATYGLASHTCFPARVPLPMRQSTSIWPMLLAINIVAIAVALWAAAVSYRSWQATREEHPGAAPAALDVGEGRTRFFAVCGMMTGLGFVAAAVAETIVILVVPQCLG